jgi:hypothetical protein
MSPKQFWRLSPIEFWWILEARNHGAPKSDLTADDRADLYELLEEMG